MSDLKLEIINPETSVLTVLEGTAPNPINLSGFKVLGAINSARRFFEKRKSVLDFNKVLVEYSYKDLMISLKTDPASPLNQVIIGKVQVNPFLLGLGINKGTKYGRKELVDLFRFNRLLFADPVAHGSLLVQLQKLDIKVEQEIKQSSNNQGSRSDVYNKVASSSLPESFKLCCPLFTDAEPVVFPVDLCFDTAGNGVQFWLESVELTELLNTASQELINTEINVLDKFVVCIEN